jgi:HAD superfamily hydrolase (TIGR01509 family)
MIKALLFDFSRVLLFPKTEEPVESINGLHRKLSLNADYKFFDHFRLNEELMEVLQKLQSQYPLFIFTSETVQEAPELAESLQIFQKIYSGLRMNLNKKDVASYKKIAADIGVIEKEIVFVDDSLVNIEAAREAGLEVIHYQNNSQLLNSLKILGLAP